MTTPAKTIAPGRSAMQTVLSIQILRGVAAVLVMLYHYAHYLDSAGPGGDLGTRLFAGGYVGVDVFFFISGFIIVYSTERSEHARPLDFSIRRFFRVVPLAQIATLLYFALLTARPTSRLLWQSLFFIPRGYSDPPKFGFPVVPQEWTLPYELLFYAIFALVLIFTHKRRVAAASVALIGCVLGFQWVLGGPFSLRPNGVFPPAGYSGRVPPEWLGLLGNPIMLEFILGMVLAATLLRHEAWLRDSRRARGERLVGIVLIGLFLFSFFSRTDPGNGLLDKGAGAACLVVGALLLEVSFRGAPATRSGRACLSVLLGIGAISYPLYLVHFGISERILRRASSLLAVRALGGIEEVAALVLTSLVLAIAAHLFVERPLVRGGKWLIAGYRRPAR